MLKTATGPDGRGNNWHEDGLLRRWEDQNWAFVAQPSGPKGGLYFLWAFDKKKGIIYGTTPEWARSPQQNWNHTKNEWEITDENGVDGLASLYWKAYRLWAGRSQRDPWEQEKYPRIVGRMYFKHLVNLLPERSVKSGGALLGVNAIKDILLQRLKDGQPEQLTDIARIPELRLTNFGDVMQAAKMLARKGLITYDGLTLQKKASLRDHTIRLAHASPTLRPHLLAILSKA